MSLRLKDFKCGSCGSIAEHMVVVGDPNPRHCGRSMEQVWISAPSIDFKRQYNHALGRRISSTMELDRELAKTGAWVASKTEANAAYDTDVFEDNVTVKKNTEERLRKHIEKQAEALAKAGVIRSTADGWKMGEGIPEHVGASTVLKPTGSA